MGHPRSPARWDEPELGTRQAGLVLVVSEIAAGDTVLQQLEVETRGAMKESRPE